MFSIIFFALLICGSCSLSFGQYGCFPGYGGNTRPPKCYTQVELGFVIDGSYSINVCDTKNFERCLTFAKNIVSYFDVGPSMARVGVITYSNNAHVQMTFGSNKNLKSTLNAIGGIPFPGSGTRTGNALIAARTILFSKTRSRVRKVLIVITDGMSSDNVKGPIKSLKDAGVEIYAVGVGDSYEKSELINMAADGKHVFTSGFESLKAIENPIKNMICEGPGITHKTQCGYCGDIYTC